MPRPVVHVDVSLATVLVIFCRSAEEFIEGPFTQETSPIVANSVQVSLAYLVELSVSTVFCFALA